MVIVWFQKDLRLRDNPALHQASRLKSPIIPLYILDTEHPKILGQAQQWWLHHSLKALNDQLEDKGLPLVLKKGAPEAIFKAFVKDHDIEAVYWNEPFEPKLTERNQNIINLLNEAGLETQTFKGSLLLRPTDIKNKQGKPYKVFTQYWKACLNTLQVRDLYPLPRNMIAPTPKIKGDTLSDWNLLPTNPNWAKSFETFWTPGELGAQKKLKDFFKQGFSHYADGRDRLDHNHTSSLSPHLHFGEISPQTVWVETKKHMTSAHTKKQGDKFLAEIGWREFCYHLLDQYPELPYKNFNDQFDAFEWESDQKTLKAWQKGKTGYPIVDAAMQELWIKGTMHNRARMIVASFLTKDLLIPWQKGEKWFWDTLLDADLANNSAGWQWVAGCGADAAPYFRIFNPVLQGEKFDPQGVYVKKWLPVLKELPQKYIHKPWEAPKAVLSEAGIELGKTYPKPIVDHKIAREEALSRYKQIKKN